MRRDVNGMAGTIGRKTPRGKAVVSAKYQNPDDDPRGPYVVVDLTAPLIRPSLVFQWHGHLPPEGRCWRYSAGRLAALESEGAIVFPKDGRPRQKRYLSEIEAHEEPSEEIAAYTTLELIVRNSMQAIAAAIAKHPLLLMRVEWRDLERVLREVFEELGFVTYLTRSGKDGGFDLELSCTEHNKKITFLIEVKHWIEGAKKPGAKVVASFFEVVVRRGKRTTGLLLSSSGFTKTALRGRTEVEQQRLRLGNSTKIVSLCRSYVESKNGTWSPTTPLSGVLLSGTC